MSYLAAPRVDQDRNGHTPRMAAMLERATARRPGVALWRTAAIADADMANIRRTQLAGG